MEHIQRLEDELDALLERYSKLTQFIDREKELRIYCDDEQLENLETQEKIMFDYILILRKRIEYYINKKNKK